MGPRTRMETLSQVGSLIESPSYYGHLTGAENLHIVQTLRGAPERDIGEVLRIVRLDGQKGKRTAHYSLGMKQRLGLAAALLGFPQAADPGRAHQRPGSGRASRRCGAHPPPCPAGSA